MDLVHRVIDPLICRFRGHDWVEISMGEPPEPMLQACIRRCGADPIKLGGKW